jgi:hypothetical protein
MELISLAVNQTLATGGAAATSLMYSPTQTLTDVILGYRRPNTNQK